MNIKNLFSSLGNQFSLSAFCLTALSAALLSVEGFYWVIVQSQFASRFNALDLLFHFGPAFMVGLFAILLLRQPVRNRLVGVVIGVFAFLSLVSGGGFLVGAVLGIIGAVLSLFWNSQMRLIAPVRNRVLNLRKRNRAKLLVVVVAVSFLVVMPAELSYQFSMSNIRTDLLAESKIVDTSHGSIEYIDVGQGYPVLVSHGAGLGYMQYQSVQEMLGTEDLRLIVPSRFGYLRTPLPDDASFALQADLFADLLDSLNISKVVIMGISIGGPAALSFATRYPDRCAALIMTSAISHTTPDFDLMGNFIHHVVFRSDFGFWVLSNSFRSELISFLGVSQQIQANMTSADEQYVSDMLEAMQPISLRQSGLVNDPTHSAHELVDFPIEQITMPTLVIHAKDDSLVPFEHGKYTAEHISGAKFIPLETGGHLLVGQLERIRLETMSFLSECQIIE